MLQQPKRPPVPPFNLEKVASVNKNEQPDLVQQYLQKTNGNRLSSNNIFAARYKRILIRTLLNDFFLTM